MESDMDSIPIDDLLGKEIVLGVSTNTVANGWYTDSMGLEGQYRKWNFRPTWDYKVFEPTSGNYYPFNAYIQVQEHISDLKPRTMTVISDRSQGGTSKAQSDI
jgi:hypothetical protein